MRSFSPWRPLSAVGLALGLGACSGGIVRVHEDPEPVDLSSPTSESLTGIWGSSSTDLWAVGAAGTILHGDGRSWTPMASGVRETLHDVHGSGPSDVWASGDGLVLP